MTWLEKSGRLSEVGGGLGFNGKRVLVYKKRGEEKGICSLVSNIGG